MLHSAGWWVFTLCCGAALLTGSVVSANDPGVGGEQVSAQIREIIHAPAMSEQLSRWGFSVSDVQHDVDAMTPQQRRQLLATLLRRWTENASYSQVDLQAQYLVTVSLLRESTLFASVISSRLNRVQ